MSNNYKGHKDMRVRFFVMDYDDHKEVNEQEFKNADGVIEYERHSVHANGVKQICLTKNSLEV